MQLMRDALPTGPEIAASAAVVRRRIALGLVGLVLVGAFLLASGPAGSTRAAGASAKHSVVLAPGQTLWEVARGFAPPSADLRAYVDAILELNGLDAPPGAGSRVFLPD